MTDLQGRSIIMVGATGGLGRPIAAALSDAGARLTLVGRDEARLVACGVPGERVAVDIRLSGCHDYSAAASAGLAVDAWRARAEGSTVGMGLVAGAEEVAVADAPGRLATGRLMAGFSMLGFAAVAWRTAFFAPANALSATSPTALCACETPH